MALDKEVVKIFDNFGLNLKKDIGTSLLSKGFQSNNKIALDKNLITRIEYGSSSIKFVFEIVDYAEFVDKGRKAGKMPPIEPLIEWVKKRGLAKVTKEQKLKAKNSKPIKTINAKPKPNFENKVRSIAFAVAKGIAKKGTIKRFGYKGSNFYTDVVEDGRLGKLKKDLSDIMKQEVIIEMNNIF